MNKTGKKAKYTETLIYRSRCSDSHWASIRISLDSFQRSLMKGGELLLLLVKARRAEL